MQGARVCGAATEMNAARTGFADRVEEAVEQAAADVAALQARQQVDVEMRGEGRDDPLGVL